MGIVMLACAQTLAVCRLYPQDVIPHWVFQSSFYSITRTDDELSIVCCEDVVPPDARCERNWRMFCVAGPLEFSIVGILASISSALSVHNISLFAVSTFDTDYILVKEKDFDAAKEALLSAQIEVR